MIATEICEKAYCAGCAACFAVCAKRAITMVADSDGFLYPRINDPLCVNCGRCKKTCPINNHAVKDNIPIKVYAGFNVDKKILKDSSSGGAFPAFANYIYRSGGGIAAAAFDERLELKHIVSFDKRDLPKFQGSKYVQSSMLSVYDDIAAAIQQRKTILFVGTPCQVAGVKAVMGNTDNLYTIDLVCHGVPSPMIFQHYLRQIGCSDNDRYVDFWFRSKANSAFFLHSFRKKKGVKKIIPLNKHSFICAYLKGWLHRESCYHCPFAALPRQGDCTISDFWGIIGQKVPFGRHFENGISMIMVNTSKGQTLFEHIKNQLYYEEKTLDDAKIDNHNLYSHDIRPEIRSGIYDELMTLAPEVFMNKHGLRLPHPRTLKERVVSKVWRWLPIKNK